MKEKTFLFIIEVLIFFALVHFKQSIPLNSWDQELIKVTCNYS